MYIQWYGHSCLRLQGTSDDVTLLFDPFSQEIGKKLPRLQADIIAITTRHPDYANAAAVKGTDTKEPFVVDGPGEYEIRNAFIYGIDSVRKKNSEKEKISHTTLYSLRFDELSIAHCGTLNRPLTEKEIDSIGSIDILLLPVGGDNALDPKTAVEVAGQIEPRIVIPICYKIPGFKRDLMPLQNFLKEYGVKENIPLDKFRILKKELPSEETNIVILNPL